MPPRKSLINQYPPIPNSHRKKLQGYINSITQWQLSSAPETIRSPHHPSTAVGGWMLPVPSYDLVDVLFKPVPLYLTTPNGAPRLRSKSLQQAKVVNLRPTWTLETIMGCLMTFNGQSTVVRPGTEINIPIYLDNLTWQDLTKSLYMLYSRQREQLHIYNHWTIYPCLMCDSTDPLMFKEIRYRVSKPSRIFIVEHAIRLRRVPETFYDWVRREGAYILLQNYKPNTSAERIAQGFTPFLDEAITY